MMRQRSNLSAREPGVGFYRTAWLIATGTSVIILLMAALTPWIGDGPATIIRHGFQTLCHQQSDRSYGFGGTPFAVCHRCFGIYAGMAFGLLIGPVADSVMKVLQRYPVAVLLVVIVPLLVDWGLAVVGLWENTALTRVVTGFAAGTAGGMFLSLAFTNQGSALPKSGPPKTTMT